MASTEQHLQEGPAGDDVTLGNAAIANDVESTKGMPFFGRSFGLAILGIFLLAGWNSGDGRSDYNVDISGIVAPKIRLPDGRHIAYEEQGVSRDMAKRNILVLHGFLSCRLAGLPGVSGRLLEKYAARVVAYDRPGIGQSDPHPQQTFNSSAQDMADIADALGMGDKFWVIGYSGGGPYAWAALRYIPHRLAGVVMFGPMGNPYAKNMTQEESKSIWKESNSGRRLLFRLAHYSPSLLPVYMKGGLMGKAVTITRAVKKSATPKDLALLETDYFGAGFEKTIRESMRSGDAKPHAEGVILHCNDWGFELEDLRPKPPKKKSLLKRIFFFLGSSDLPVFSGPIHIFHGTEDTLVPLAMSRYAKRMLPELHLHILEGHGHFSWFCYCDSCHRELFKTLFGEVEGLDELDKAPEPEPSSAKTSAVSEGAPLKEPDVAVTGMLAAVSSEADGIALQERNVDISDDAVEKSEKEHEL